VNSEREFHNLALIGFMGVGKTSVGKRAARRLGFRFVDTDLMIEAREGRSIPEIFAAEGEPYFRGLEAQVVAELASERGLVIATGGGLGANPEHLQNLKRHALVVCLWASPDIIWERVQRKKNRPLLAAPDPKARIRELLNRRMAVYRQADVLMNTGLRPLTLLVRQVVYHFRLVRGEKRSR